MNRPIPIVIARIIVWIPIFTILQIGWLSISAVYNGLRDGSAYEVQNKFYLSIHEIFEWSHATDNNLKAALLAVIVAILLGIYFSLYRQAGKQSSYNNVLTLIMGTFLISFMFTYWFRNLGYYFLFASIAMLLLFLLPSSKNYLNHKTAIDMDEDADILDAEI